MPVPAHALVPRRMRRMPQSLHSSSVQRRVHVDGLRRIGGSPFFGIGRRGWPIHCSAARVELKLVRGRHA